MARRPVNINHIPFKYFHCPFCGAVVSPTACGRRYGKMKCPVCKKKCYRQTFVSNCPVGCLVIGDVWEKTEGWFIHG
jgi:hypothetical protein